MTENKDNFISGILQLAKKNLEKDGYLVNVLFIEHEEGILIVGLVGIKNRESMRKMFAQIGKKCAKDNIKINIIYLLSDATIGKFPMEMMEAVLDGKLKAKDSKKPSDSIVISEWKLKTDHQSVISQNYHKEKEKIIFDNDPVILDNVILYMLDPFVQNYRAVFK